MPPLRTASPTLADLHLETDGPVDPQKLALLAHGGDAAALRAAQDLAQRRFADARALILQRAAATRRTAQSVAALWRWRRAVVDGGRGDWTRPQRPLRTCPPARKD